MKSVYIFIVLFICNELPLLITSLAYLMYCLTIESACNDLYSFNNVSYQTNLTTF